MGYLRNNFVFISLLILAVIFSPINYAHAKGVFNILNVILFVTILVFTGIPVPISITGDKVNFIDFAFGPLGSFVACQFGKSGAFWSGCGGSGSGGGIPTIVSSEVGGCRYQVPLTFYIPSYGQGYQEKIYYTDNEGNRIELPPGTQRYRPCKRDWTIFFNEKRESEIYDCGDEEYPNNCAVPDSSGSFAKITEKNFFGTNLERCVGISSSCEQGSITEGNQIAIYRFTLPDTADQGILNDWFMNSIKNQVGNGFINIGSSSGNVSSYWTSSDSGPFSTFPVSQVCSGNVCRVNDATAPENSYVVYGAKILGGYSGLEYDSSIERNVCYSNSNKFLNTNNSNEVQFPFINQGDKKDGPSWGTGNVFLGPYKTQKAECPAEAMADVKLTTLGCKSVAVTVKVNDVSQYSGFDVYANDKFVGSQNIITKETVYTIPELSRRSTNNFKISVKNKDNLIQDFIINNITTVCPPECRIVANPAKLIFPQGETQLSWNCLDENNSSTADSCSMFSTVLPLNHSSFSNFCSSGLKGSMMGKTKMEGMTEEQEACSVSTTKSSTQVSLDKPATFVLSCQNQDGSSLNSAFVDFLRPVYQETIPR